MKFSPRSVRGSNRSSAPSLVLSPHSLHDSPPACAGTKAREPCFARRGFSRYYPVSRLRHFDRLIHDLLRAPDASRQWQHADRIAGLPVEMLHNAGVEAHDIGLKRERAQDGAEVRRSLDIFADERVLMR